MAATVGLALMGAMPATAADALTYPVTRTVLVSGDPGMLVLSSSQAYVDDTVGHVYAVPLSNTDPGSSTTATGVQQFNAAGVFSALAYDAANSSLYLAPHIGSGMEIEQMSTAGAKIGTVASSSDPGSFATDSGLDRVYVAQPNLALNGCEDKGAPSLLSIDGSQALSAAATTSYAQSGTPVAAVVNPSNHGVLVLDNPVPGPAGSDGRCTTAGDATLVGYTTSSTGVLTQFGSVTLPSGPGLSLAIDPAAQTLLIGYSNKTLTELSLADGHQIATATTTGDKLLTIDPSRGEVFAGDGSTNIEALREADLARIGAPSPAAAGASAAGLADDSADHRLLSVGTCSCGSGSTDAALVTYTASGPVPPAPTAPPGLTSPAPTLRTPSAVPSHTRKPPTRSLGAPPASGPTASAAGNGLALPPTPVASKPAPAAQPNKVPTRPIGPDTSAGAPTPVVALPGPTATYSMATAPLAAGGPERATAGDADAATSFSTSLLPPDHAFSDLAEVGEDLLLAALLLALLALPVALVNRTLLEHDAELAAWAVKVRDRVKLPAIADRSERLPVTLTVGSAAVLGGLLYTLVEPSAGTDRSTLALGLGLTISLFCVSSTASLSKRLFLGRAYHAETRLRFFPGFLLIAAACVALSRIAGLQPGLILGSLTALVAAQRLSHREEGQAVAISGGCLALIALGAWLLRTPFLGSERFWPECASVILTGITVSSSEWLLFELLPLAFFEGASLWAWSRPIWAGLAGIGAFAFTHLLLGGVHNEEARPFEHHVLYLAVLSGIYLSCSVSFWAYFRYRGEKEGADESEAVVTEAQVSAQADA